MHPNPAFRQTPEARNLEFARSRGFGTLALNAEPGPLLAHVPFLLNEEGTVAELHLVRSNPILRLLDEPRRAVISIWGPDSYVSPDWYEDDNQVPTWNYVAVHLRGQVQRLAADELRPMLERLSAHFEAKLAPKMPWRIDKMDDEALERMLRMIVPCRFEVAAIEGTWKLGQNKPEEARLNAAEQLGAHGIGMEIGHLADLMRLGSAD